MAVQLKAARVNANLTQAEACELLGISRTTLLNYEQYKTIPDIETAKKMAKLYGMAVDDIIFFKK